MAKNNKSDELQTMLRKVRKSEAKGTPEQKVVPVKVKKEKEVSLGVLVPEEFRTFVRMLSAKEGLSIKDIVMTAIKDKYRDSI
jgi:hypothetical protein